MLDRRHLAIATLTALAAAGLTPAVAATKDEAAVADAIEAFRKAMLGSDRKAFAALCADALSYGHSSGKLQNKTVFIDEATNPPGPPSPCRTRRSRSPVPTQSPASPSPASP